VVYYPIEVLPSVQEEHNPTPHAIPDENRDAIQHPLQHAVRDSFEDSIEDSINNPIENRRREPLQDSSQDTSPNPSPDSSLDPLHEESDPTPSGDDIDTPHAVAPAWHTALLIAAIIAVSVNGAHRLMGPDGTINRALLYTTMAAYQLLIVSWVFFGLWLRKARLRSITGQLRWNPRAVFADIGVAAVFWICSMMVIASFGLMWVKVEQMIRHPQPTLTQPTPRSTASLPSLPSVEQNTDHPVAHLTNPQPATAATPQTSPSRSQALATALSDEQRQTLSGLERLAPSSPWQIIAWILLSLLAGICEEIVFRGYLQRQFEAWTHGRVIVAVLLTAICFGAAHAYQGPRGMFLIGVYGGLFSLLALVRGTLRPGMIAHGWHDMMTGIAIAVLHAHHVF